MADTYTFNLSPWSRTDLLQYVDSDQRPEQEALTIASVLPRGTVISALPDWPRLPRSFSGFEVHQGAMDSDPAARSLYAAVDAGMVSLPMDTLRDVQQVDSIAGVRLFVRDLLYKTLATAGAGTAPVFFLICNDGLLRTIGRESRALSSAADQMSSFMAAEIALIVHRIKEIPSAPLPPEAAWAAGVVGAAPGAAAETLLPRGYVLGTPMLDVSYVDLLACRSACASHLQYSDFVPSVIRLMHGNSPAMLTSIARPPAVLAALRGLLDKHSVWRESGVWAGGSEAGRMPRNAWQRAHRLKAGRGSSDADGIFRPSFLLPLFPDVVAGMKDGSIRPRRGCVSPPDWLLAGHPEPASPSELSTGCPLPPAIPPLVGAAFSERGVDTAFEENAMGCDHIAYLHPTAQIASMWRTWLYDVLLWTRNASAGVKASAGVRAILDLSLARLGRMALMLSRFSNHSTLAVATFVSARGVISSGSTSSQAFREVYRLSAQNAALRHLGITIDALERVAAVAVFRFLELQQFDPTSDSRRLLWRSSQVAASMRLLGLRQTPDAPAGKAKKSKKAEEPINLSAPLEPSPFLVDFVLQSRSQCARRHALRAACATPPAVASEAEAAHASPASTGSDASAPIIVWSNVPPPDSSSGRTSPPSITFNSVLAEQVREGSRIVVHVTLSTTLHAC